MEEGGREREETSVNVVVAFDSEGSVVKGTGGKREWWKSKTHRHTQRDGKKKK